MLELECLSPPECSPQLHLHPRPMQLREASPVGSTSTINLSRAYTSTVLQSDSYMEMWRITSCMDLMTADHQDHHLDLLSQVLRPDRDHVLEALQRSKSKSKSNSLFILISSYFHYSEQTTSHCLTLRRSVAEAHQLYRPINTLLHDLPIDSLSQSHCDLIFQEFLKFIEDPNPFPRPDSQIQDLFRDLNRQLERRLRKSSSRIRIVHPPAAEPNTVFCCGSGGSAVITAYIPPKFARRELAYAAQLRVASTNTYVLKTDLDTLNSLVRRMHNAVEDDKCFIQQGLNLGNYKHTVQEVLIHLGKNYQNMVPFLDLLKQKITTCLTIVNDSRSQLLQKILLHQTTSDSSHPNSHT